MVFDLCDLIDIAFVHDAKINTDDISIATVCLSVCLSVSFVTE